MKTKKTVLFFLSAMVMVLAVGCTTSKNNNNNLNVNELSKEESSRRENKRKEQDESPIDDFSEIGQTVSTYKSIFYSNAKASLENISVTLNKVYRGAEAQEVVDKFNESNKASKIASLEDDSLEYVIIEYTTTLPKNIKNAKNGQTSNLDVDLKTLDNKSLINEDENYIIRKNIIETEDSLQAGDSGVTKVVFTLPKTTNNFIIKLGDSPENMASFIIK